MASFCTKCGASISEGAAFCLKCGARIQASASAPPDSTAQPPIEATPPSSPARPAVVNAAITPPAANPPGVAPTAKSGNLVLKIILGVLGLFALLSVLAIGSCVYIGYRVKKKADQLQQAYKKANVGKVLGALSQAGAQGQAGGAPDIGKILGALSQGQSGSNPDLAKMIGALSQAMSSKGGPTETRPPGACPNGDQAAFESYIKSAASASIPLEAGMTLTDIWSPRAGQPDVEILHTVKAIDGNEIVTTGARLIGQGDVSTRNLCTADLLNAREYETGFGTSTPDTIPGATMFSVSQAVFSDLKAGRPASFTFYSATKSPGGGYILSGIDKGTLSRVEADDVPYSIIVNGASKETPTIHAKGILGTDSFEAWVLDDASNPLVLKFEDITANFHIDYVKITFPVKKEVEQQLAQTGRAEIYGIYFDFNKATPRPESAPVLKEIAQALKDNPAWKLKIEGHTDNIGGEAYNLNLSQKRAEGVMQALITQYSIAADRLSAKGYGATRPKATNATVEGRALNRRVELVRE